MSAPADGAPAPRPRVPAIQKAVADRMGLRLDDMLSRRRDARTARGRQIAMYLARELTPLSLTQIGRAFGRDHTTVMHAVERVEALCAENARFARMVADLREALPGELLADAEMEACLEAIEDKARAELRAWLRRLAALTGAEILDLIFAAGRGGPRDG